MQIRLSGVDYDVNRLRESDKEGHKKTVPLSARPFEIVKKRLEGRFQEDWIFINPVTSRHYTVDRLSQYWKRVYRIEVYSL